MKNKIKYNINIDDNKITWLNDISIVSNTVKYAILYIHIYIFLSNQILIIIPQII
jgi:hypothetical protein